MVEVDGVRGGHRGMTAPGRVGADRSWSRKGEAGVHKGALTATTVGMCRQRGLVDRRRRRWSASDRKGEPWG
jgi:hypothetical protein